MTNNYDINQHMFRYLREEPFYAALSRHINKFPTDKIPTAGVCVNKQTGHFELIYNPKFFASLTEEESKLVIKHELLHLVLEHVTSRAKDKSQQKAWNHATDLAINSEIFPKEAKSDIQNLMNMCLLPGKAPYDDMPHGKSAEFYFDAIQSQQQNEKNEGGDQQESQNGFDDHEGWSENGDNPIPQDVRDLARERLREAIQEAANEANRSSSWGSMSADMKKEINKRLSRQIDWKKVLRYFIKTSQKADKQNTVRKVNKRFAYIHPGRKSNRTAKIAIAIDQSGSVSDDMLVTFFAELDNLASLAEFTVIPFDDRVEEEKVFVWKKGQRKTAERVLCGGTNFDSPTKFVNERNFDSLIVLTDMCAPAPIPSKVPRMWMCDSENAKNPYFKTNERVIAVEVKQPK